MSFIRPFGCVFLACVLTLCVHPTSALESAVLTQAIKAAANGGTTDEKKKKLENGKRADQKEQAKDVKGEEKRGGNGSGATADTQEETAAQISQLQEKAIAKTALESAFGQLDQLAGEFGQLHQDDNAHVNKLLFHMRLRHQLREKIAQEEDKIKADDEKLVSGINAVKGNGIGGKGNLTVESIEGLLQNALPNMTSGGGATNPSMIQITSALSFLAREKYQVSQTEQQLAHEALGSLLKLDDQIGQVRAKDLEELEVLKSNSKNRQKLKAMIKAQQERLDVDTSDLAGSLSNIEHMASGNATSVTTVAPTVEKPSDSVSGGGASTAAADSSTDSAVASPPEQAPKASTQIEQNA